MNISDLGEADRLYSCTSDCDHELLVLEVKFLVESAPVDAKEVHEIKIMWRRREMIWPSMCASCSRTVTRLWIARE